MSLPPTRSLNTADPPQSVATRPGAARTASAGQPAQDAQELVQQVHQAYHVVDRFQDGADQRAQNVGPPGNARHVDRDRLGRYLQSEDVQVTAPSSRCST